MKKMVLFGLFVCLLSVTASAQTKRATKKMRQTKKVSKLTAGKNDNATTLSNTTSYPAFAPTTGLRISDPTINRFNERAAGSNVRISGSGIAGMPKGSYGFANGHILLRNTTAASSGTSFGSGAVGTGTSIQGVGTSESTLGVNGKSPDAGPWLWGDKRPVYPNQKTEQTTGKTKQQR